MVRKCGLWTFKNLLRDIIGLFESANEARRISRNPDFEDGFENY
jgi:hypothetical protein